MNKTLGEWLTKAAAIAALATFALAYIAGDELVVFLGVLGIAYLIFAAVLMLFSGVMAMRETGSTVKAALIAIGIGVLVWAMTFAPGARSSWAFKIHEFGFIQCFGIAAALFAVSLSAFYVAANHKAKHKPCPDCAETVLEAAHVCRYCGYRWSEIEKDELSTTPAPGPVGLEKEADTNGERASLGRAL